MKKIYTLCLAGALALAVTSCKEEQQTIVMKTIAVNGVASEVQSALYTETPADSQDEAAIILALFPTLMTELPDDEPDFYIGFEISESLVGKTLDLTKPLDQSKTPAPYLYISAMNGDNDLEIEYFDGGIEATMDITVTSGSLTVTRNGDDFAVKFFVKLSDGSSASTNWDGTAIKIIDPV